jgi:toxin ParE1/3/4
VDFRLEWSPEAVQDIESIAEYIGRDSPRYAVAVVDKIVATGLKIERSPKAGRITPEFGLNAIRERSVFSYRIIYRICGDVVTIATVIHGKRMLDAVQDRFND